ncbi:hypothetical protein ACF0H5_022068 [Mactra antiquata]
MYKTTCLLVLISGIIVVTNGNTIPCLPNKEVPCTDPHAACLIIETLQQYTCQCLDGYKLENDRCKAQGKPLPLADYESDWILATECTNPPHKCDFNHSFGEVPAIVDVQIDVNGVVYQPLGFRPDEFTNGRNKPNFVTYIYDEQFVNLSTTIPYGGTHFVPQYSRDYVGMQTQSRGVYYSWMRVRAWKFSSLPDPDFAVTDHTMKANTSKSEDSFYEISHGLDDYPGIVVVRAEMEHDNKTFYANGVGSALNAFYDGNDTTNAYLVYGFNNDTFRVWVDSSTRGAIFDGRKFTKFPWLVSEATVQIYAWKLSTITPYMTRRVSLNHDDFVSNIKFPIKYRISNALNMPFAEIHNDGAVNNGYRFPASSYMGNRYDFNANECLIGGVKFGYYRIPGYFLILSDISHLNSWFINIPVVKNDTGLLCIPRMFGNGVKTEKANGGTLVMYSWINDCDEPSSEHATFDTSVNGTEVGSFVEKTCEEGYESPSDAARCNANYYWYDENCYPVKCDDYTEPSNGTAIVNGTRYGSVLSYKCNQGFRLLGDEQITCLSNGSWSSYDINCTKVTEKDESNSAKVTEKDESNIHTTESYEEPKTDLDGDDNYSAVTIIVIVVSIVLAIVFIVIIVQYVRHKRSRAGFNPPPE